MSYTTIDNIIYVWASNHGLQLNTRYQDTEVRTAFLSGSGRERGQIWVDPPSPEGEVVVHAAVYRKRGKDNQTAEIPVNASELGAALERAYALVADWLAEARDSPSKHSAGTGRAG